MTPKEQEIAIKELEERVDRLRNIYEQYFLGFERLEPTVPRKDVDRRLAILRKEQIRNTAMRFRLNVIVQKYNTYAMHWVRICRQIEEGTYKRHVRRAKARFGELSSSPVDRELSIDIDMDDFDMGVEDLLAEADAAAARQERAPSDTLPPPSAPPPPSVRPPASSRGLPAASDRGLRAAALPPGAKPRVVLRKRDDSEPALAASAPRMAPAAPAGAPPSAERLPAASPSAGAPGAGRIPVAASTGSLPSSGRLPVAPPGGHAHRAPVAPPGAPAGPQIRPLGSGGRLPVAAPASAPHPSAPRTAPASSPRIPGDPGAVVKPPPARAPMPSYIEKDTDPGAPHARPPGTRPRAPLPLPTSGSRPPGAGKKE